MLSHFKEQWNYFQRHLLLPKLHKRHLPENENTAAAVTQLHNRQRSQTVQNWPVTSKCRTSHGRQSTTSPLLLTAWAMWHTAGTSQYHNAQSNLREAHFNQVFISRAQHQLRETLKLWTYRKAALGSSKHGGSPAAPSEHITTILASLATCEFWI